MESLAKVFSRERAVSVMATGRDGINVNTL